MSNGTRSNGAPLTGAPACPTCGGRMWDNRATKRNPKAPDFKCRDRTCDGVLWPGQHNAAVPIFVSRHHDENGNGHESERDSNGTRSTESAARARLQRCYLALTDFALTDIRSKYEAVSLPCTDATVAAIVATMFIATCRAEEP